MEKESKNILPEISVIIPCYNSEKYIIKCINSICSQTFKNIEIIIIDSSSNDLTLELINSVQDDRIKIITTENKGPSAARNLGLKEARGKFISFIDSDDWTDIDFYEKLYEAITLENADIACASVIRYKKFYQKYNIKYTKKEVFYTLEDKIKAANIPKCCYAVNKLYRSDIIKNVPFAEGVYFEDIIWTPQVIKKANKIVTVPNSCYYYRKHNNSIVKTFSKTKEKDCFNAKRTLIDFFDSNNLKLDKKERNITKKCLYFKKIPVIKIKENKNFKTYLLFGVLPVYRKKV